MGETLGVAFGGFVVTLSLWLLYQWAIKERAGDKCVAGKRGDAPQPLEPAPKMSFTLKKRYEVPTTKAETTLRRT